MFPSLNNPTLNIQPSSSCQFLHWCIRAVVLLLFFYSVSTLEKLKACFYSSTADHLGCLPQPKVAFVCLSTFFSTLAVIPSSVIIQSPAPATLTSLEFLRRMKRLMGDGFVCFHKCCWMKFFTIASQEFLQRMRRLVGNGFVCVFRNVVERNYSGHKCGVLVKDGETCGWSGSFHVFRGIAEWNYSLSQVWVWTWMMRRLMGDGFVGFQRCCWMKFFTEFQQWRTLKCVSWSMVQKPSRLTPAGYWEKLLRFVVFGYRHLLT